MSQAYDFQDRMATGKQAAMDARNRGRSIGNGRVPLHRRPVEDTPENRVYADLDYWRKRAGEAENTIDRFKATGAIDPLDEAGAEFDRLFEAGKVGLGLPAEPRATASRSPAREDTRGNAMTKTQYLKTLKELDLTPAGAQTAAVLGLSLRQCQRIAAGTSGVPETLALLLAMYLKHGLPALDV